MNKCHTHVNPFVYSLWTNCYTCVNSFLGSEHGSACQSVWTWTWLLSERNVVPMWANSCILWTNCCICVNSFLGSEHAYLCDPCKWTKCLTNVNLYLYFQCTQCLTCMNSFVGSEGADLCKWFPAGLTAVGSLPAVYPAVGSQTAGIGERLVTHLTLEVGVPVVWFGFGGGVVLDNGCHLVLALIGRFVWI